MSSWKARRSEDSVSLPHHPIGILTRRVAAVLAAASPAEEKVPLPKVPTRFPNARIATAGAEAKGSQLRYQMPPPIS